MTSTAAGVVRPVWPVLTAVAVLAGLVAAGSGVLALTDALTATGLPDPGPATTLGLPFVRAAGEIAAVIAVGGFLFAAFLTPPQHSGVLDVAGYRALRLARGRLDRVGGVRGDAGAVDHLRRVRKAVARSPQPGATVGGRRTGRHRQRVAVDGVSGR